MPAGRPLKYETNEELQEAIEEYFADNPEKPTQSGLALHLGFNSRQSLYNYKERDEFLDTIKKAFVRIDNEHEKRLFEHSNSGSIFYLKNRGWSDKMDITTNDESLNAFKVEIVNAKDEG